MSAASAPARPDQPSVVPPPGPEGSAPAVPSADQADVVAQVADFAELTYAAAGTGTASLDRLLDVNVTVTAELGRVTLSIGDILKLNLGAVLELDRPVSEPVDLMVQGVRLARGEVVVVDDRFAIRLSEIADPKKRSS